MAGLKKPVKKRDPNKPSPVLVIFLVFFVLLSIGVGVWGYYGYAGQDELKKKAEGEVTKAAVAKKGHEYNEFLAWEMRQAIGVAPVEDMVTYAAFQKKFAEDSADFKIHTNFDGMKKMVADMKTEVDYDEAGKKYATTYKDKLAKLAKERDDARSLQAAAESRAKDKDEKLQALQTKVENYWKEALANIKKDGEAALAAAAKRTETMADMMKSIEALESNLKTANDKSEGEKAELDKTIKLLKKQMAVLAAEKNEAIGMGAAPRPGTDVHALLLDISKAKPLWDNPLGKITRVDMEERQVTINLGTNHGVKPELTFNIFAAGWGGRADKVLKGSIEVIRVLDANTSICRVTSLYDAEGKEIILNEKVRGQVRRESENALKEGDLLFNMFWGSRVAIAGNVSLSGDPAQTPAEQMRQLSNFIAQLERNGITVDAYLDLTDGTVKGAITPRTRYLIRGDDLFDPKAEKGKDKEPAPDPEPKKDIDPKKDAEPKIQGGKKDEEPKEKGKANGKDKEGGDFEQAKTINQLIADMRKQAADRGMFIISADNFLGVIGYRPPRSANLLERSRFQPVVLFAGSGIRDYMPPGKKDNGDKEGGEKMP